MKRYTDDAKRTILDELAASGQSRAAFCRERNLCYRRVGRWLDVRRASTSAAGFVEVEVSPHFDRAGVEVWLSGSVCVRFDANTPTSSLVDFCRKVSGC